MTKSNKKTYVISLGGSLLVPGEIDTKFISEFVKFINKKTAQGFRFIIVTGGGKYARTYIEAGNNVNTLSFDDMDSIGISVTRVNAELVRSVFGKHAAPEILYAPTKVSSKYRVTIAGGWKPGRSTDDVSVHFALLNNVSAVVNLSNIDKLYTADPKKDKRAMPIDEITWKDFQNIIGTKRVPGGNYPFDPVAAQSAKKGQIKAFIASADLKNLDNMLTGKPFKGTSIY